MALPARNGRTQSGVAAASELSAQPSSVTTNAVLEGASHVASQEMSAAGHRIAVKNVSCPDDSAVAKKEESRELKRYNSALLPTPMEKKRKFKPSKAILLKLVSLKLSHEMYISSPQKGLIFLCLNPHSHRILPK